MNGFATLLLALTVLGPCDFAMRFSDGAGGSL